MHRVLNYGSALQAYALQQAICDMGFSAELIDYIYPNKEHLKISFKKRIKLALICIFFGNFRHKKKRKFEEFYHAYFKCSDETYKTSKDFIEYPTNYDIYITGSDQVWNPIHVLNDNTFLLDFVPDEKSKISYASSFSVNKIDYNLTSRYSKYLSRYKYLSVREYSGVKIINDLISRKAEIVCDPTLLLNKKEWLSLLQNQQPLIKKPYILVYILRYSFYPYPEINKIINDIQRCLDLHVVILDVSSASLNKRNSSLIKDAGPLDFLNLVSNAEFVITTSFHGTAFATNLEIPFYSVISRDNDDTRIIDFLRIIGAQNRAIFYNDSDIDYNLSVDFTDIRKHLEQFKSHSRSYLSEAIKKS